MKQREQSCEHHLCCAGQRDQRKKQPTTSVASPHASTVLRAPTYTPLPHNVPSNKKKKKNKSSLTLRFVELPLPSLFLQAGKVGDQFAFRHNFDVERGATQRFNAFAELRRPDARQAHANHKRASRSETHVQISDAVGRTRRRQALRYGNVARCATPRRAESERRHTRTARHKRRAPLTENVGSANTDCFDCRTLAESKCLRRGTGRKRVSDASEQTLARRAHAKKRESSSDGGCIASATSCRSIKSLRKKNEVDGFVKRRKRKQSVVGSSNRSALAMMLFIFCCSSIALCDELEALFCASPAAALLFVVHKSASFV